MTFGAGAGAGAGAHAPLLVPLPLGVLGWYTSLTHRRPYLPGGTESNSADGDARVSADADATTDAQALATCPQHLLQVVRRCWAHEPSQRPTVHEVVAALQQQ